MNNNTNKSEFLALERTKLANERTSLAYFRSFIVILSSGLAIIKIDVLHNIIPLGYFFIVTAIILLSIGIVRFFYVKKRITKYFNL